jgi:hypothetical protein
MIFINGIGIMTGIIAGNLNFQVHPVLFEHFDHAVKGWQNDDHIIFIGGMQLDMEGQVVLLEKSTMLVKIIADEG